MTHSLHRQGNSKSLERDYVFLCTPAKGINTHEAAQKMRKILDILMEVGPVNIGFYGHGSLMSDICIEDVKKTFHDHSRLRCCFDSMEKIREVLQKLKSEDMGLSVTVSGLISELKDVSRELSIRPHTANISCGVFGKVDRLPPREVLEISTMCGHGMIGHRLVTSILRESKEGKLDIHEAVR